MKAEVAVAWPLFLDGHIRLQLVLEVTITGNQNGVAAAASWHAISVPAGRRNRSRDRNEPA
jgi:hypothetical protein